MSRRVASLEALELEEKELFFSTTWRLLYASGLQGSQSVPDKFADRVI